MGWIGFNCSLPPKQAVIEHLDGLAESARLIGAVNCIVDRDGQWIGENTDGQGFLASLRDITDPAGQRVIVLGSGGAARAIAVELALAGAAAITVVSRNRAPAAALAELICSATATTASAEEWADTYLVPNDADILVNATSVGFAPNVDARLGLDPDTIGFSGRESIAEDDGECVESGLRAP
jgi:shikimate dehydrogenase